GCVSCRIALRSTRESRPCPTINPTSELFSNVFSRIVERGAERRVNPSAHMLPVAASPFDRNALCSIVAFAPVQTIPVPQRAFLETTSSTLQPSQSRTLALKPYVLSPLTQERAAADFVRSERLPSMTRCWSLTAAVDRTTSSPHWSAKSDAATSTAQSSGAATHEAPLSAPRTVSDVE